MHAMVVAKAEFQKKRIRLVKASGMGGEGLGDLMEKQWVEKANIALMLMDGQEENIRLVSGSPVRSGFSAKFRRTATATGCLLWQDPK